MDFLKLLRSAEEALYEVMMWLLLYATITLVPALMVLSKTSK